MTAEKSTGIGQADNTKASAKNVADQPLQDGAALSFPTNSLEDVQAQLTRMRGFFNSGATLPIESRRKALVNLRSWLKRHEDEVLAALHADLGKAPFEAYATELGIVYDDIRHCLSHMGRWAKPKRVATPIVHFRSKSKVYASPLGVVLVMSPWNYPLQLTLAPLAEAIAAGNCVAVKPSRTSAATTALIERMLAEVFDPRFVFVFPGSSNMNDWLLQLKWDLIFFTGSPSVGHVIMEAAAKHLTPVVLELGGKSPCIIDRTANVKRAAQRVAWGKGINSGQTCVAPDYFLVHEDVLDEWVRLLKESFEQYYGEDALACEEWPHIINRRHFDRVMGLIKNRGPEARLAFGGRGDANSLKIEPTCLLKVSLDDAVMKEEIFGPVLPVISYRNIDEAFATVRSFEKPLACYLFSDDKALQQRVIRELPFGGATINDVVIHLANGNMGFGGVGNSGMGAYHGKVGFDTFSHYKSTLTKGTWLELPVRVPPFGNKIKLLRMLMR